MNTGLPAVTRTVLRVNLMAFRKVQVYVSLFSFHSQQDTVSAALYVLTELILLESDQYWVIYIFSACHYTPQRLVALLYVFQTV